MSRQSKSTASSRRDAVAELARKAKVPAIAAGAGLAGLAGGAALGRRSHNGTKSIGMKLGAVAKNVGELSEGVGSVAGEIRRVREGIAADGGEAQRRSPIEVVLQGLTSRRSTGS
jgi:hypothetical protein